MLGRIATAQGAYLLASGVWPLVHYGSFERVTGPKADKWLVQTVAGLAATAGAALLRARRTPQAYPTARAVGVGSALTFGAVDVIYGATGRIRRIYLADAVVEAIWLAAWTAGRRTARS